MPVINCCTACDQLPTCTGFVSLGALLPKGRAADADEWTWQDCVHSPLASDAAFPAAGVSTAATFASAPVAASSHVATAFAAATIASSSHAAPAIASTTDSAAAATAPHPPVRSDGGRLRLEHVERVRGRDERSRRCALLRLG
jgi:hypothetical protein